MRRPLFLWLVACTCGSVLAQDAPEQTVEGAQEFLAQALKDGVAVAPSPNGWGIWVYLFTNSSETVVEDKNYFGARIESVDAPSRCITRLTIRPDPPRIGGSEAYGSGPVYDPFIYFKTDPVTIDWSKVATVTEPSKATGYIVELYPIVLETKPDAASYGNNGYAAPPSDGLVWTGIRLASMGISNDRIAYAMEFLRINCDATAETGF